jgi:hypothetical protein
MAFGLALLLFSAAAASSSGAVQPVQARLAATPAALDLFEQDWVLMNWALKYYDRNGDVLLQADEAQAAAAAFRKLADTNGDGRVTIDEYRAARALILSRD